MSETNALDEAFSLLRGKSPEFPNGNSNHAPMVAEAMTTLGHAEAAVPWVNRYRESLENVGRSPSPVSDCEMSLGRIDQWPAWVTFFERQIEERGWTGVLSTWVERLAPGLASAATHGIIRVGHAARALSILETPVRRTEAAEALAYWAATFQDLEPREGVVGYSPFGLPDVPVVRPARRGNIQQTLAGLDAIPATPLVQSIEEIGLSPERSLSTLTETFAGVFVANERVTGSQIALIHGVTGPAAVRLLLPYVRKDVASLLVRHAWQTALALYSVYAIERWQPHFERDHRPAEDLAADAVATGAAHAIKFTEACLREHALNPSLAYLTAAASAIERVRA